MIKSWHNIFKENWLFIKNNLNSTSFLLFLEICWLVLNLLELLLFCHIFLLFNKVFNKTLCTRTHLSLKVVQVCHNLSLRVIRKKFFAHSNLKQLTKVCKLLCNCAYNFLISNQQRWDLSTCIHMQVLWIIISLFVLKTLDINIVEWLLGHA